MLDAIDQVMGVLALEALVEREGLQAGEADDVRMLDAFGGHAVLAQQLRADLCDLMQAKTMDECGMLSAEIVTSVGNGCTRPLAI
jgi:hypothetical protein